MNKELELKIFERDGNTCKGCRKQFPTKYEVEPDPEKNNFLVVDHIEGKSDDESNLQTLCWSCNCAKAGRGKNAFRLGLALKRLGRCMTYYPSLARIVGLKESIFLCQLIYWTPRARHEKGEGWLYKSVEEMEEETGLSYKEQIRLRKSLVNQGLLEEKYDREEHNLYFRVNTEELDAQAEHMTNGHMPNGKVASAQKSGGTCPKVISHKEAEITQEITQQNILSDESDPAPRLELVPDSPSNEKAPPKAPPKKRVPVTRMNSFADELKRHTSDPWELEKLPKIWAYYCERTERGSMYLPTERRVRSGLGRLRDLMNANQGDEKKARYLFKLAIDNMANDKFLSGENDRNTEYRDWLDHLCKNWETFERRLRAN